MSDLGITTPLDRAETGRRRRFARFAAPRVRTMRRPEALTEGAPAREVYVRDGLYRRALALSDGLAAALALFIVVGVRAGDGLDPVTFLAFPTMILVCKLAGLYERDEVVLKKTTLDEAPALLQITGLFALIVSLGHWQLFGAAAFEPGQVLTLWVLALAMLLLGRALARAVVGAAASPERCLLIGDEGATSTVRGKLTTARVNAEVVHTMPFVPRQLIDPRGFSRMIEELDIHRVVIAPLDRDGMATLELIRIAKSIGVRISVIPRLLEVVGSSVEFDHLDGLTMVGVRRFGLTRSSRVLKRGFDLAGATVGLIAVAPIMAVIALMIRIDSRGPVFFRQERVGRDGKRFGLFKFRSMEPDAEAKKAGLRHLNEAGGLFKIENDPRITRVGRMLRKTSLDELPQLINVLRGEMSLVGPRPLVVDEDAMISGLDRSRLHLTPGMTGHWQILGSARVPLEEMVGIDYLYVANWSLWTDVKLLLRTVPFVLLRRGL
jgi:exopolysaccharide biosynthesis polyprenyl glycosylphosphotransferase